MKNFVIGLVSVLVLLIIAIIVSGFIDSNEPDPATTDEYTVEPKSAEFALEQLENEEDFLLVLSQPWCEGCKHYKKYALPEYLKSDYSKKYPLVLVDMDENPQSIVDALTTIAPVQSTPTTYLVKDGKLQNKLETGKYVPSYEQLESYIKDLD